MNHSLIRGRAARLDIANLDTDQIMPKQFLRGIDKAGLDKGVLYDLRFDGQGRLRPDFVLNRPGFAGVDLLLAGANFGCGSSREHAVWGMQQFGFKAVVASSFGEIFYSNAMNNRLLLAMVSPEDAQIFQKEARALEATGDALAMDIDVARQQVSTAGHSAAFTLSPRHQRMFLQGQDWIGASMAYAPQIAEFAQQHWQRQPWVRDVAATVRARLS
ncbi:3-isopropylmalate dehydratase small subunit [Acidovorax sp. Be4]|uniref:3-isopropylmalate dehydratase n=1 Tax=Acidovorax bellezanensis TaxID=2976702 RepID=A0ABT2PGM2_9BURK|nr:3-isopropylmalate dehydratase small subunit [Acidovorax sp. Be4]MCT9809574.1 3-isopropylmalate dehydratase small subunit [Acidovorax sp. Be4]